MPNSSANNSSLNNSSLNSLIVPQASEEDFCPIYLQAQNHPSKVALVQDEKSWSYEQLDLEIENYYLYFFSFFSRPKTTLPTLKRVAFIFNAENYDKCIFSLFACMRLGVVVTLLNPQKATPKLLDEIKVAQVDGLIGEGIHLSNIKNLAEKSELKKNGAIKNGSIKSRLSLKYISLAEIEKQVKRDQVKRSSQKNELKGVLENRKVGAKKSNSDFSGINLFTSGTTAALKIDPVPEEPFHEEPFHGKLVVFKLGKIWQISRQANLFLNFTKADKWLLALPLFHVSGLSIVFRVFSAGGCLVMSKKFFNKPTDFFLRMKDEVAITQRKVTHASLVIAQLNGLLKEKRVLPHLKQLKKILIGGSSIPQSVWDLVDDYAILPSYGMTESFAQIATYDGKEKGWFRLLPGREVKLDKTTNEILLESSSLMEGYYGLPFDKKWFRTGDLGEVKREGQSTYLKVSGRRDNQFISGGENIQPEEIEAALLACREVVFSLVVPMADEKWGQVPVAFIALKAEEEMANNNILGKNTSGRNKSLKEKVDLILKGRLEKYKIPKKIYLIKAGKFYYYQSLGKLVRKEMLNRSLDQPTELEEDFILL